MKNTNMRFMEYFMVVGFILLDKTYNMCESGVVIITTPTEEDEFTTTGLHTAGADTESETTTTEFEAETVPATESSHTEYTTYESEVETMPGSSKIPFTAESSKIQSTAENPEVQSTTTEHSEHVVISTEESSDVVITEASSDTITLEYSTDAGMATTTEPSPILSRTESPDPDLVDCCEWDGCENKLGINSYCRFHDYSNSTYCDERNSSRRKKREVVVQTTVSTTEFPGKPGKCWCRLGFHILRRNGPCVPIESPQPTRDSEVTVTPRDIHSPNPETTTPEMTECVMDEEISFGTTCRNERLNDSPGFDQDDSLTDQLTDPTADPATDPPTPNEPGFCYNWTCVGQNCSLQVTDQNITCQRTGSNCWVTKMCLLTDTEYMFSCADPCISVPSSPSVDCYSVPCTTSVCNNQTSSVDDYTCFSSDGCCVSITRIMIGVVFIVTNVLIYICPL